MRKLTMLGTILMIAMLLFLFACERKIVNENGKDLESDASACFTCHGDQDLKLVAAQEQWKHSVHASGANIDRTSNPCLKCHTAEGFLATLPGGTPATGAHFTAIGCFTCHSPHTKGNLSLRVTAAATLPNGATFDRDGANLCAACHHGRENVVTFVADSVKLSNRWGPHHSNQADMLIGENAYEYAGYDYENSYHAHGTTEGCLNCHMTGSIGYSVGGHTFNMADEERGFINTAGCNVETCHDGAITSFDVPDKGDFDEDGTDEGVQTEITHLLDSLKTLLMSGGLLEEVVGTEGVDTLPTNNRIVKHRDSSGALFNYYFVREDRSEGVHNTEYAVGLLKSSINYLVRGNASDSAALLRKPDRNIRAD